ncbi:hypothetical protein EDB84DRAFT_1514688 [Lactarius hengduanensis]|nr:hypothetical protein EDB84DRAFT_1514688 [Lactarius hengduanensis]
MPRRRVVVFAMLRCRVVVFAMLRRGVAIPRRSRGVAIPRRSRGVATPCRRRHSGAGIGTCKPKVVVAVQACAGRGGGSAKSVVGT